MNRIKEAVSEYSCFLLMAYLVAFYLRMSEAILIGHRHAIDGIYRDVLIGFLMDIPLVTLLICIIFPIYFLIYKKSPRVAGGFVLSVLILLMVNHLFILQYFSYFLIPLNRLMQANTIREMIFSVSTSDIDSAQGFLWLILIGGGVLLVVVVSRFLNHAALNRKIAVAGIIASLVWFPGSSYLLKHAPNRIALNVRINKSLFFYRVVFLDNFQYKYADIQEDVVLKVQEDMPMLTFTSDTYPLMNQADYGDVLGKYISSGETPPDIVLIIVEGLGTRFLEPSEGLNLMPFLDSLVSRSIWWPNCLASSERSFGAVPSLTGSLPHGFRGFTFLDPMPAHYSLLTMVKRNGYQTNYFYGQGAWFHRKDYFLRENLVDRIIDNSLFPDTFTKVLVGRNQYFWGYSDNDLFAHSLEVLDTLPAGPHFSIYFTGTMHSPFIVPDPGIYDRKLDSLYAERDIRPDARFVKTYKKYLRTLVYTDDAIREFFRKFSQRPEYRNTLFILTGDHPMTEIPIHNWLKRYQVPMIIYSPMLNRSGALLPVVSHNDLMPTLMGFLKHNFNLRFPPQTQAIGNVLDTASIFRNLHPVAMMNTDRNILDYFWEERFLADGKYLFRADSLFHIYPVEDPDLLNEYRERLNRLKQITQWVCRENRLVPDSLYLTYMGYNYLGSSKISPIRMDKSVEFLDLMEPVSATSAGDLFLSGEFKGVDIRDERNSPSLIVYAGDEAGKTLLWEPIRPDTNPDLWIVRRRFSMDRDYEGMIHIKVYFWNNLGGTLDAEKSYVKIFQQKNDPGYRQ